MPSIALIIVTYNGMPYIPELLASLKAASFEGMNLHLIFVDNNSQDETMPYLQKHCPEADILSLSANMGYTMANNMGIYHAKQKKCDYVYLLNQDTIVDPFFLQEILSFAQNHPEIGAIQSQLRLYPWTDRLNNRGNAIHFLGYSYCQDAQEGISLISQNQEIPSASGAGMLLSVDILEKTGLFEDFFFMYADDQDLCWRMRLQGFTIYLAKDSIVYHKYEFSKSIKQYYYMERNRLLLLLLNYKWRTIFLLVPAGLFFESLHFVYGIFHGLGKKKLSVYGFFFSPLHWKCIYAHRKKRQKIRTQSDKMILSHSTGTFHFVEAMHPVLTYIVNPLLSMYFFVLKKVIIW